MSMPVMTLPPPSNTTSFHLDGGKETIVLKLGAPNDDDREIDVFDAEKYFNEGLHQPPKRDPKIKLSSSIHHFKKDESLPPPLPPKISTLRSTRSESSTNSQSALLNSNNGRNPRSKSVTRKGFLASIVGCNCSCVDKNSLEIDDCTDAGDLVRKSAAKAAVSPIRNSTISKEVNDDDDGGDDNSDGSSDLFEIESFSKGDPFLTRQASDGGLSRSTCYAPSEASIEWSVVTASAAAVSDSEEVADKIPRKLGNNSKSSKEILKLRQGILSGCKSQKSISVAGDAHRPTTTATATIRSGFLDTRKHQAAGDSLTTRFRVVLPQSRPANAAHMLLF